MCVARRENTRGRAPTDTNTDPDRSTSPLRSLGAIYCCMPRIEAIDGPDDSAASTAVAADAHCQLSGKIGWDKAACLAAVLAGAATLNETGHGCPARYDEAFAGSFGWSSPARNDMRCRPDGRHRLPGTTHVIVGDFNRSSAFGVDRPTCASFRFGRAKAAKQPRQTHRGPALLGADRDLGKVLSAGRAGRFSLMNMGMNYSRQKLDGLWTPCTNVAFIMCALRGWLPGQGGVPLIYLATPGSSLMRRCRPCGECRPELFWDECYIVRSEYCMLDRYCANGHEIWTHAPGNWTCAPRAEGRIHGELSSRLWRPAPPRGGGGRPAPA